MSARALMTLAKLIVERATSNRRYAEASAKVCINVIEVSLKLKNITQFILTTSLLMNRD